MKSVTRPHQRFMAVLRGHDVDARAQRGITVDLSNRERNDRGAYEVMQP